MTVERRGAAIEIKKLRREFTGIAGTVLALDGVDLSIAPGEFVCIVGPSGCGKSTLLRILAGLDRQTSGTIDVEAEGWKVQNAMVFQESGLFPWMTVEDNVAFGLMTRGVRAKEERRARRGGAEARRPGPASASTIPTSSPAACASAAPLRARSSPIPPCC